MALAAWCIPRMEVKSGRVLVSSKPVSSSKLSPEITGLTTDKKRMQFSSQMNKNLKKKFKNDKEKKSFHIGRIKTHSLEPVEIL
jgi:hypothetical protein